MYYFWLIIAVTAMVIDLLTSNFLFIGFTLGGFLAILTLNLQGSIFLQIIVFALVSCLFILLIYPQIKKYLNKEGQKFMTTEQRIIGREYTAEEEIKGEATVKLEGIYWTVRNEGADIKKGERFLVERVEGNKLVVRKKEDEKF
ncbi:MAG TPA: NfeD family protein [Clostridia bacterium]|jgi:membrane protein implicated in regulation of membrane protease activity|nr:NfeD family protein [Clostridia bacterium]